VATSTSERFNIELFPDSTPAYFFWQAPGKQPAIRLSLDLVDRLSCEITSKFADINSRGSELGGILLGRVAETGEVTFFIEDYELIECGHDLGALFLLSDEDKSRMVEQLLRLRSSSSYSVIGFFRSHTRKNLSLGERDLSLLRDYFADAANVFLLIKPFAAKPSTAGFFIWEDGHIRAESSYRQFPFKRSELLIRAQETIIGRDAELNTAEPGRAAMHRVTSVNEVPRQNQNTMPPEPAPPLDDGSPDFEAQNSIDLALRQISRDTSQRRLFSARPDLQSNWSIWQQSPPPTILSRLASNPGQAHLRPPASRDERPLSDDRDAHEAENPVHYGSVKPAAQAEAAFQGDEAAISRVASGRVWLRWTFLLLFAAIVGTAYVESRPAPSMPAPKPPNNALDLSIARDGGGLELHWNRQARPIATATNASIQIEDGNRIKDLELTPDQLRFGRIIYFPLSDDVSFQLEVSDAADARSISESIHTSGRLASLPNNPAAGPDTHQ
jgi:hypothetical protein